MLIAKTLHYSGTERKLSQCEEFLVLSNVYAGVKQANHSPKAGGAVTLDNGS